MACSRCHMVLAVRKLVSNAKTTLSATEVEALISLFTSGQVSFRHVATQLGYTDEVMQRYLDPDDLDRTIDGDLKK